VSHPVDGLRVLVVEDEALIAMELEDRLAAMGCVVVGPAANVARALALLASERPDLALLDVNLGRERSTPVAEALRAAGVPFLLATGYDDAQLTEAAFRDAPRLGKPVDGRKLALAIALAAGRAG
jgi:DNA-binding NarL/FixJ family response regulator